MASLIDPTKPVAGSPTTQSVRDNFLAAKNEIEALQQILPLAGPAGPAGPPGIDGAAGPAGPTGPAGADGGSGPGNWVLLQTIVANNSPSIYFQGAFSALYDEYEVIFQDAYNGIANAALYAKVDFNGTWHTTGWNYAVNTIASNSLAHTYYNDGGNAPQLLLMPAQYGGVPALRYQGRLSIGNPNKTDTRKFLNWGIDYWAATGYLSRALGVGSHASGILNNTEVVVYPASGNIAAGTFRLYGKSKP